MKNKIIYLVALLFVITVACSKEFSESTAIGALSEESLQNEVGVNLLLTSAYSVLDGMNRKGGADWHVAGDNWWMDVIADDAHKGSTDGDQADLYALETFNWSTSNPYIQNKWKALFAGVNRCNAVLDVISKLEGGDFASKEAEAKFLRGYFYFELQKMWGNVPYISLENYQNTEFNQPNPGPVWDKIEEDFQYAIDNLPSTQSDAGRPVALTAKAFLGKVKLYQSQWSDALTLFNDVISSGKYSLIAEFGDNFKLAGENSSESVFAIQFTADDGQSYNGNRGGTLNWQGPFGCCGFYQPTQDLVNSYQTDTNGLPLLDNYNQTDVKNDYGIESSASFTPTTVALDPRLDYTVGRRGIEYNGYGLHPGKSWVRSNFSDISGPYSAKKSIYQEDETGNMGTGAWGQQRSGINYYIMRYADVLLMAAEAAVETNDLATALDYVNQVRNRAKNMTYIKNEAGTADAANYVVEPYTSFADQTFARKAVRMERRLELGMEGHRLFDLRRWGNADTIMNSYFTNEARVITSFSDDPRPYQNIFNLFPIPVQAIDLSGGILTQNPGY